MEGSATNIPTPWVLLIRMATAAGTDAEDFAIVEACCRFYGLGVRMLPPGEVTGQSAAWPEAPVAVVMDVDALSTVEQVPGGVPMLVVGVNTDTDQTALQQLTGGVVRAGVESSGLSPFQVQLGTDRATMGPLAGQTVPATAARVWGLEMAGDAADVIASVADATSPQGGLPCCVRLMLGRGETWLAAASVGLVEGGHFERAHFGQRPQVLVLALLFLRAATGDHCWHAPAAFANLCIDDPRLTEPYGHMSYPALLGEAQRAGFHATIGFIPWNYDRNSSRVVELFKQNPRWLSIAVHGNNHDRFEFYGPQRWRESDPWQVKGLATQEACLRQAVVRMEEFSRRTGLPHDRVMVFPHAIGSAGTLRLLKHLGFAGTANYNNFSLGTTPPTSLEDCLSAANTGTDAFPALRRDYPHNRAEWTVALDLFLGNPALFMAHQDLFDRGITAFNATAAMINRLEPAVRWTGLGEVFRGLYRQRRLADGSWEIQMLSDEIDLRNESTEPRRCRVCRDDPHEPPMERITVDGADATAERNGPAMFTLIDLAPGETRRVAVQRAAETRTAERVALRRAGLRNRALRGVAEFRDLWLSGTAAGRWLTGVYYHHKLHRLRWQQPRRLLGALWNSLKPTTGRRTTANKL